MKEIIYLFIFLPLFLTAQSKGDTVVSKQGLVDIQIKQEKLESNLEVQFNTHRSADSLYVVARNYAENADKLVNHYKTTMQFFFACLTILVSLTIGSGLWGFKKRFEMESDKQIDKLVKKSNNEFSKILIEKDDYFKKLISKHEVEYGFISKSKILVINKVGTTVNEHLNTALKRFSKKVIVEDVIDLETHIFSNKFENFNLIIFDNTNTSNCELNWDFRQIQFRPDDSLTKAENGTFKKKLENQNAINSKHKKRLIEIATNVCEYDSAFFYFGKNDDYFVESLPQYSHLINFANSPSTAFSNIINLLYFRDLFLESKHIT